MPNKKCTNKRHRWLRDNGSSDKLGYWQAGDGLWQVVEECAHCGILRTQYVRDGEPLKPGRWIHMDQSFTVI
jgi:hypothetical protein